MLSEDTPHMVWLAVKTEAYTDGFAVRGEIEKKDRGNTVERLGIRLFFVFCFFFYYVDHHLEHCL